MMGNILSFSPIVEEKEAKGSIELATLEEAAVVIVEHPQQQQQKKNKKKKMMIEEDAILKGELNLLPKTTKKVSRGSRRPRNRNDNDNHNRSGCCNLIPLRFQFLARPRSNSSPALILTPPPPPPQVRRKPRTYSQTLLKGYAKPYQPPFLERLEFLRALFVEELTTLLPLKKKIERRQRICEVYLEGLRRNTDTQSERYQRDTDAWEVIDGEVEMLKARRDASLLAFELRLVDELELVECDGVVRMGGRKRSESVPVAVDLALLRRGFL